VSGVPDGAIDECLSIRAGRLFVEGCDATLLAQRFGTPVHVVSEDQLRRNARRIRDAFASRWPEGPVNVLPSIKANFTLALRRVLTQEGMGCDTFGPGELEAALRCAVPPALISVNGTGKDEALIERAVAAGARITLDAVREIDLVRDAARRSGRRATVRFRIRPAYEELVQPSEFVEEDVPIRVFASAYKPGIPTPDLVRAGPEALAAEELDVSGVMAHLGRHHHSPDVWRGMVRGVVATLAELSRAWGGWMPREIDLGGGFPSPRDPTGRALRRATGRPERVPPVEDHAEVVTSTLREEIARHGLPAAGLTLEVEPGRALYADAGIHLASVVNVKAEPGRVPPRWIETDTTEMFLPDLLIEHNRWAMVVANRTGDAPAEEVDVVGKSCGFDVLGTEVALPPVRPGDVLAFLDTGAYQDAASANFNALPRPATVLVCEDTATVVKRAETVEDVFARDIVPARLEGTCDDPS
jgi:diaminopimelate decarboxylase